MHNLPEEENDRTDVDNANRADVFDRLARDVGSSARTLMRRRQGRRARAAQDAARWNLCMTGSAGAVKRLAPTTWEPALH